jgi:hypothetical protein
VANKTARNLGTPPGTPPDDNAALLLVERLLKGLLDAAIVQLIAKPVDAERYFSHFFDTTVSTKERDQFLNAFRATPPRVVLGYARSGAELPCFAIVMTSEEETDSFLGDFLGQEGAEEYRGAFFTATYTVYTYATHPDMAQVLYQVSKAVIHAGKRLLLQEGCMEITLGGGELAPDENYMPENMYVRALRVTIKHPYSAPFFLPVDPAKLRVLVFACDVDVDGRAGGVHPYVRISTEDGVEG